MVEDSEGDWQVLTVNKKLLKSDMKNKTRIYFDDFVNAVHNCDRRSQFCERQSQFSIEFLRPHTPPPPDDNCRNCRFKNQDPRQPLEKFQDFFF
jgi:hypothetical protein